MGCFEVLESGEGIQDEIARRLQDTGALACGWSSPLRPHWRWRGLCFCWEFARSI